MAEEIEHRGPAPLADDEIAALRALLKERGETRVCAEAQVSRPTLTRGMAGLPVQRGSRALLRSYIRGGRHAA